MLTFLGMDSLEQLFSHIPAAVRIAQGLDLPDGTERARRGRPLRALHQRQPGPGQRDALLRRGRRLRPRGAGRREDAGGRSEFVTAYTPYQPEVAQGVLQAVFEYQTLVSRLSGLPVANASLYDGGDGHGRGAQHGLGRHGRQKMVGLGRRAPALAGRWWRPSRAAPGHEIVEVPCVDGLTDWASVDCAGAAAVVASYPNYLGVLEDMGEARAWPTSTAPCWCGRDPVAAGVLRTAGRVGGRRLRGRGPGLRHAPRLRRALPRPVRLHGQPRCAACPGASSARPSTPTTAAPSSPPCARASRTSAARRRRPTSAPTRP
jgi:glycine dehydrogenase subunit 1